MMKAHQSEKLQAMLETEEDREKFRRFLATRQGLPLRFVTQVSRKITLDK